MSQGNLTVLRDVVFPGGRVICISSFWGNAELIRTAFDVRNNLAYQDVIQINACIEKRGLQSFLFVLWSARKFLLGLLHFPEHLLSL